MIGRHTRFRENGDLLPWQGPAAKKKPPFSNARALITRQIMCSRDAQCNTMDYKTTGLDFENLAMAQAFKLHAKGARGITQ